MWIKRKDSELQTLDSESKESFDFCQHALYRTGWATSADGPNKIKTVNQMSENCFLERKWVWASEDLISDKAI